MPALLVFGFVKIFKNQLALNPTKKQYFRYVASYLIFVISIGLVVFGFYKLLNP